LGVLVVPNSAFPHQVSGYFAVIFMVIFAFAPATDRARVH
jgi:hypothetical protein